MLKPIAIVSAALLVLSACDATLPTRDSASKRGDLTRNNIESTLETAAENVAPVPKPALVRAKPAPVKSTKPEAARFNLNSEDTPAKAFFMALVDQTNHNIVVHPDVTGNISLMLQDVTVREVLEVVSDVYGYSYRRNAAGFIVLPATLQSRIFQINYLNLQRSGVSRTRVSSGQVSEARDSRQNNSGVSGAMGEMQFGNSSRDNQQISGSGIETSYEADFWSELQDTLQQIVGDADGHQVVVNSQTGVIVVRAMPEKLRSIGDYLETIQDIAQRQVVLEAKIVEVQLSDGFRSGINWISVSQNSSGDTFTFGQQAPPPGLGGDLGNLGGRPVAIQPGNPITGFTTETLGSAFAMAFDVGDFNAFLELLELQGETRVLSSPRVSTLNNQKAVIKAGTDEFFVTDISSNTVTGTSSTTSKDVELTPFFSGIALDVTPQISADGEVTLHIHPTVSDVVDQQKILTVSGETDTLPLAFSEIRESDSIVRARSGQIIVIGGLMRNSMKDESFGTPVLSKIPGVGNLFKSKRSVEQKTELVILLKPIVVDSDDVWTQMAGESLQRVQQNFGN